MARLTKKEFGELCGIAEKNVYTYIQRGNVLMGDDGYIDTSADKNVLFVQKRQSKKSVIEVATAQPIPMYAQKSKSYDEYSEDDGDDEDASGMPSLTTSERKKKYLETIKIAQEIELLKLREEKIRGDVVPADLMKPLFLQHNQSIVSEFKNTADEIVRIFAKRKKLNLNEIAEIKGELVSCINVSIGKATKASVKAVDNIIAEHSESRGRGERK